MAPYPVAVSSSACDKRAAANAIQTTNVSSANKRVNAHNHRERAVHTHGNRSFILQKQSLDPIQLRLAPGQRPTLPRTKRCTNACDNARYLALRRQPQGLRSVGRHRPLTDQAADRHVTDAWVTVVSMSAIARAFQIFRAFIDIPRRVLRCVRRAYCCNTRRLLRFDLSVCNSKALQAHPQAPHAVMSEKRPYASRGPRVAARAGGPLA